MATSNSLNAVGDKVSRLKRVGHAERAHRDAIADAGHTKLITDETSVHDRLSNALPKSKNVLVASVVVVVSRTQFESGCLKDVWLGCLIYLTRTGFPRTYYNKIK